MSSRRVWRVHAPAKINLSLRVVRVRDDGYHELRTIFQSIALHDTLVIRERPGPFALQCDAPACPTDRTNLVWRAADRVWAASGRRGRPAGVEVQLTKRVPQQAGLGGGSSDCAAALRAFGALWGVEDARVRAIGGSLGADVPYFFEGGTVLGLDRGDLLFPLVVTGVRWVVLVMPDFGVSTRDAFSWWDSSNVARRPRDRHPVDPAVAPELGNDLQAPVAARHPEIARLLAGLERAGASYATMSGSGAVVFGLFADHVTAKDAARRLRAPGRLAWVSRTLNRAAYQRLAAVTAGRINLPFAPRSLGHS